MSEAQPKPKPKVVRRVTWPNTQGKFTGTTPPIRRLVASHGARDGVPAGTDVEVVLVDEHGSELGRELFPG